MTQGVEEPLFELVDASIHGSDRVLLEAMSWRIRDRAVTVILGPAGTGKSTLLRSLAGRAPAGVELRGSWQFAGGAMAAAARRVAFVPQRSALAPRGERLPPMTWQEAVASPGTEAVLLDEPTVGLSSHAKTELCDALRERARSGAVVLVTHDLAFAKAVADDLAFLCAGRLVAAGPAEELMAAPPSPLLERFLRQGNSWPDPPPPKLPQHFRWILPARLAGMGKPGLVNEEEADLVAIASAGVELLVSLTDEPFPATKLAAYGMRGRHFPIADMGVPAVGPAARLCRDLAREMADGTGVTVHCHAGLGRTGTMLAAVLVWLGRSPEAAIAEVRSHSTLYIQSAAQFDFVRRFAEACGPSPDPLPNP